MLLLVSFLATGLLLVVVGIPLQRRRVGPNHLYGVRLPATLADQELWHEVNAKSGRDFVIAGVGVAVVALAICIRASRDVSRHSHHEHVDR